MIFISHNNKDKPVVEQIAVRLGKIYGQDRIFYDSWSIQPGDGIIDKMNSGLENSRFFFLFVSKNSINSSMVKLEWQNALLKAVHGELKIIPVRLDSALIPLVLRQTLYLDLYTNGLEVVLSQMVSVINGKNTFFPQNSEFSNLKATYYSSGKNINVDIYAEHYMEPKSSYLFLLNNIQNDVDVRIRGSGSYQTSFVSNITLGPVSVNGWKIAFDHATIPGFPVELVLENKSSSNIKLLAVLHEKSQGIWEPFPLELRHR